MSSRGRKGAMIVLGALALSGGAGAVGAGGATAPDHTPARQASLDAARARWKAFGADSYTYKAQASCNMCVNVPEVTVKVVGGKSTVTPKGNRDVATVPRLFAKIQRLIDENPYTLSVTYGARSGAPSSLYTQDSRGGVDDVSGLRISGFRRLPR
jgi:hypothetical protein